MADRRLGDRREPQKGTINIKFKDAIIYLVFITIIIISFAFNIVLLLKNMDYKETIKRDQEYMTSMNYMYDSDMFYDDEDEDEDFEAEDSKVEEKKAVE